ncbi:helix-turn-helix transcriptional regulator [Klebsiella variicola]|uniref:LuxR family transcriptional regulator KbvR n=1 Tax=Klebsiella variicola TaxID=244366 RepID=UPI000D74A196|nr:LuxR family transcriptional regulator KbvR [Klebsiella variicola]PXK04873.1 helix-turn-helix transcriptional regulator [Klebsiella variicola]
MTNFLFNIKNHYLRVAIAELVNETMQACERSHYQFSQQWKPASIAQADVIFTEMVAGEWYLCHELLQHATENYQLFTFLNDEEVTVIDHLPNCFKHAVFIHPHTAVHLLKEVIGHAIQRPLTEQHGSPFNRLRRCINCPCKSLSDAQTKVIYAFSIGLSPHEVATVLKISHKTIHSHKKNIMNKFHLKSRQQFNNLVQILARR